MQELLLVKANQFPKGFDLKTNVLFHIHGNEEVKNWQKAVDDFMTNFWVLYADGRPHAGMFWCDDGGKVNRDMVGLSITPFGDGYGEESGALDNRLTFVAEPIEEVFDDIAVDLYRAAERHWLSKPDNPLFNPYPFNAHCFVVSVECTTDFYENCYGEMDCEDHVQFNGVVDLSRPLPLMEGEHEK